MDLKLTFREKWAVRAIYSGITAVVVATQSMAFDHARMWAKRHATPGAEGWEGLAFGIGIEMPAAIGLLLLQVWPKIAANKSKRVPRLLLAGALVLSFTVQQMYAGPHASGSTRFVAGFPSVLAFIFVHVLFMVMGLIDETKRDMAEEAEQAALKQTRQRVGLGDIATAPTLTPPVVSPDIAPTPDRTPSPARPDMVVPDMPATTGHDYPTPAGHRPDIPQLKGTVSGGWRQDTPWADLPDSDPDSEDAERVAAAPDVLTLDRPDSDTRHDTNPDIVENDDTSDVRSEPDKTPKWMTMTLGPKAAELRRNGATIKSIAEQLGKSERTISRWDLPEPDSTKPVNGRTPHLVGTNTRND